MNGFYPFISFSILSDDLIGAILAAVINQYDFNIFIILFENAVDTSADGFFPVINRNDDTYLAQSLILLKQYIFFQREQHCYLYHTGRKGSDGTGSICQ